LIIGFDDLDLCETTNPSLSSVSQSGYQLGTTAARLLFDRKEGDASPAKHIVLKTVLKLRDSVAPPLPRDTSAMHGKRRSRKEAI
jgi:LacI family transcriptional regulator